MPEPLREPHITDDPEVTISDEPQWGEPGYVPPPKPPKPVVALRPGQRRTLLAAFVLSVLGQLAYWTGLFWDVGDADCYQFFGHPAMRLVRHSSQEEHR